MAPPLASCNPVGSAARGHVPRSGRVSRPPLLEYSLSPPALDERTRQAEPARAPVVAPAARARGPRAADRAAAFGVRAPAARRRGALDDRGRAPGLGDAGARRDDPALA